MKGFCSLHVCPLLKKVIPTKLHVLITKLVTIQTSIYPHAFIILAYLLIV